MMFMPSRHLVHIVPTGLRVICRPWLCARPWQGLPRFQFRGSLFDSLHSPLRLNC